MRTLSRPGYVYVMANPSLPGWHKVGHTHRPPHRRAKELSRTALPTAFDVAFARFFWDAPAAEKEAHHRLSIVFPKSKEFFHIQLNQAVDTIKTIEDAGRTLGAAPMEEDLGWEETLEGREELWEWAEQDWNSSDPQRRRKGWRAMEQLSAAGWGEASWRLAELLMRASPDRQGAQRAAWVLDAAHVQGQEGAALRAAWLRSWESEEGFEQWRQELTHALARYGYNPQDWPERLSDTVYAEVSTWPQHPHRRLPGQWKGWIR